MSLSEFICFIIDYFSLHYVICGWSSVLIRRQSNTLCTSSFIDGVVFSHNGVQGAQSKACFVQFTWWRHQRRSLPFVAGICLSVSVLLAVFYGGGGIAQMSATCIKITQRSNFCVLWFYVLNNARSKMLLLAPVKVKFGEEESTRL